MAPGAGGQDGGEGGSLQKPWHHLLRVPWLPPVSEGAEAAGSCRGRAIREKVRSRCHSVEGNFLQVDPPLHGHFTPRYSSL